MVKKEIARTLAVETVKKVGEKIKLFGWVEAIRDHGQITFLDLRDRSGVVQCVGQALPKVTPESVVEIKGSVSKRPENLVNPNLETGAIEVKIENLEVMALASEMPIPISGEGLDINEVTRLKYRYLD